MYGEAYTSSAIGSNCFHSHCNITNGIFSGGWLLGGRVGGGGGWAPGGGLYLLSGVTLAILVSGFQNKYNYQGRFRDLQKEELISVVDF